MHPSSCLQTERSKTPLRGKATNPPAAKSAQDAGAAAFYSAPKTKSRRANPCAGEGSGARPPCQPRPRAAGPGCRLQRPAPAPAPPPRGMPATPHLIGCGRPEAGRGRGRAHVWEERPESRGFETGLRQERSGWGRGRASGLDAAGVGERPSRHRSRGC